MKAWLLKEQTGLSALELAKNHPDPNPGKGQVRLKVLYAALNPADRYLAEKAYPAKPTFPHILGRDGMGVIDAVGEGVTDWNVGDRAAILRGEAGVNEPGTLADFLCVDADLLVSVPDGWGDEQAAGAPLVFLTAYQALTQWGDLAEGSSVLITGASGGVGLASVMLAKSMGCQVIGLSRSQEKSEEVARLGADAVFDPTDPELVKKIKEVAGREGVAVAVDNVGGELFSSLVASLGHFGAISCVGRLSGPVAEFNTATLFFKRKRIGGVSAGDYSAVEARETWEKILSLLDATGRKPVIDQVFEFGDLLAAFDRLAEGPLGKVVVKVNT